MNKESFISAMLNLFEESIDENPSDSLHRIIIPEGSNLERFILKKGEKGKHPLNDYLEFIDDENLSITYPAFSEYLSHN